MKPSDTGKRAARRYVDAALTALYWAAPSAVCLILYWHGLNCFFSADDFAWLNHATEIHTFRGIFHSLFAPEAQGTIRPWSERGFFLVFYRLFGLDPLPFRIWVFLTQFANLTLIVAIMRRLSGARAAGLCAALLWIVNSSLAQVMTWTSAYNQVMCAFFLLAAFYFLLRWIDTGRQRDWVMQWVMYLLGFGALELNIVYPVLAAGFTFLCARKHFLRTLPLFIPAAIFVAVHRMVSPAASGVYTMHFDASMWTTLRIYWEWMLGASWLTSLVPLPKWEVSSYNILLTVALVGLVIANARRRNWLPLFLLLWFLAMIAPVLPLRDHRTEYYPFLPAVGVAMLGAYGLAAAWRNWAWWPKAVAGFAAALYLAASLPAARISTEWYYQRSLLVRKVVLGVARAQELHPGKAILLDGVDDLMFWSAIVDGPFALVGAHSVYLTPGSEKQITPHPELGDPAEFVMPPGSVWRSLLTEKAVVYSVRGERLRNITTVYFESMPKEWESLVPARIDAVNPATSHLFGPEWYPAEGDHRWMPRRASVKIAGPRQAAESLHLRGEAPKCDITMRLTVTADGLPLPPRILKCGEPFTTSVPLPKELVGKASIDLVLEVDRVITVPGDQRTFGLVFGTLEVRP